MIADRGGADCCYGGIGWCGHIAFWESHMGHEFDTLEEYKAATARIVELHPMTIMQNALHSFGGDWSWVVKHLHLKTFLTLKSTEHFGVLTVHYLQTSLKVLQLVL